MTNRSDASFWPDRDIILYDGVCVLCSGWTRFVLARDRARRFRFTPIQSDYGRALAIGLGIDPDNPDTNAVLMDGFAWRRSDAALQVVGTLPGWRWVRVLRIIPRPLRDVMYRLIARNRYRWFGRHAVCDLGGPSLDGRVLTRRPAGLSGPGSPPPLPSSAPGAASSSG